MVRDADGNPIGRASTNPIIDTRVYEVEFPDGTIAEYAANTIAEALYSKVDADGDRFLLLKEIVDHCKDDTAISQDDYSFTNTNGSRNPARHTYHHQRMEVSVPMGGRKHFLGAPTKFEGLEPN